MKKFILIYHAPASVSQNAAKATPEQQAASMEGWMKWAQKTGKNLLDLGTPLINGKKLGTKGTAVESGNEVGGYSIIQANDMGHALTMLEGHPHLSHNNECRIEIHESMPIPGM